MAKTSKKDRYILCRVPCLDREGTYIIYSDHTFRITVWDDDLCDLPWKLKKVDDQYYFYYKHSKRRNDKTWYCDELQGRNEQWVDEDGVHEDRYLVTAILVEKAMEKMVES